MRDKRILSGDVEDLRWMPGVAPGLEVVFTECIKRDVVVELEVVSENLETIACAPQELSVEPIELPNASVSDTDITPPESAAITNLNGKLESRG
jgi:hypothetical protein